MSNIKQEVVSFHSRHPDMIRFVSGKWFDDSGYEITNIDKYFFDLSNTKEFFRDFLFFKNPEDIHKFEELYITGYGTSGLWPQPPICKHIGLILECDHENYPLPFPLTLEQLLIIGVMLFRPEEEVFFICTGVGGSGKSTFGNIVKQLFDNDVAHVAIDELEGYKLAEAVKHRLIYSEELSHGALNCKALKELSSKQEMMVEPKYITPYNVLTQSALFWNCNRVPSVDIEDSGLMRRCVFYMKDTKIANPDLSLRTKVFTHDELVIIASYAFEAIGKHSDDWRDFFKKDTFLSIMKENKVYKFWKEGAKTYDEFLVKCDQHNIKDRFIPSLDSWQKTVDFILENDEQEKLPF